MGIGLAVAVMCAAAAVAAPFAAHAETYKWVDTNGVVNYGNAPPGGARQVARLDEAAGRVSTIPSVPREKLERERRALLEARVERLERELDDLRRAQAAAVAVPAYAPYPALPAYALAYPVVRVHGFHRPPFLGPPVAKPGQGAAGHVSPRGARVVVR
jgi:hypothetical protein